MRIRIAKGPNYLLGIIVAAGLAAFTLPVQARQEASPAIGTETSLATNNKAENFIKQAARGNDLEISLAEVGLRKAQNADLKSLCQMIQTDHTKANQQLQPLAQKYNLSVDQTLKHDPHRELTKFDKEATGSKFDQQLATEFLRDHQRDIAKFEKASAEIQAPDLKQYIDSTLPVLRKHFDKSQTVAQEVGVPQSTISEVVSKTPGAMGGTGDLQEQQTGQGAGLGTSKGAGGKALQQDKVGPSPQK